jgi:hypothetical protein
MTVCRSTISCVRLFLNKYGKPSQISPNIYMAIVNVCVLKADIYFYQKHFYIFNILQE